MIWHALANCRTERGPRPALVMADYVVDLADAAKAHGVALPSSGTSVNAIIQAWAASAPALATLAGHVAASGAPGGTALDKASFLAPFAPRRIFCAASNYIEHADEMATVLAAKAESQPYIFIKSNECVIGSGDTVVIPTQVTRADWEVELGVVIGGEGKRISAANALDHIAGYTVVNDVSARDKTRREDFPFKHDWFRGKSYDTFLPMGPYFVPRDCLGDPHSFRLGLSVNGEMMQDGLTADMIFNSFEQIAYLSDILALKPGDLIATGTPAGVGMGRGIYLKDGDVMDAWVEGIGHIQNPVAAERGEPT